MRASLISGMFLMLVATALAQQQKQAAYAPSSGKAVLEAYASAWNRHDAAAFDKILAPDAGMKTSRLLFMRRGAHKLRSSCRRCCKRSRILTGV